MSGGSGGDRYYEPTGGGDFQNCDLDEIIPVNSPVPSVVNTINVGDPVDIVLASNPKRIQVITATGQTLGSLTWTGLARIMNCLENGETYKGEIISINNGAIEIRVTKV